MAALSHCLSDCGELFFSAGGKFRKLYLPNSGKVVSDIKLKTNNSNVCVEQLVDKRNCSYI